MNKDEIKTTLPWLDELLEEAVNKKADDETEYERQKIKVFISMAMSDKTRNEVHENYFKMLKEFSKIAYIYGLNLNDFEIFWTYEDPEENRYHSQFSVAKRKNVWLLGHALQALQRCDFVLMNEDDFNANISKGVQIEHEVCKVYNIPVMYI